MDIGLLIDEAIEARKTAYAPYSEFYVGAALLTEDGRIFRGCNVEAPSFLACCAERNALYKAVSEGCTEFAAIAVVGGGRDKDTETCPPCGICRQALSEFCTPEFKFILATSKRDFVIKTMSELLPLEFKE